MPSDEADRITVTFTKRRDILELIRRDAELEDLPEAYIVRRACITYYDQRKREAELFNSSASRLAAKEALVFETPSPDQLAAARVAKIRDQHGPEKS